MNKTPLFARLLLAVLTVLPALARADDHPPKGPGCGGVDCKILVVSSIDDAKAAAEALGAKNPEKLKTLVAIQKEEGAGRAAKVAIGRPYGSEYPAGFAADKTFKDLEKAVAGKKKYWRAVADLLYEDYKKFDDDKDESAASDEKAIKEKVAKVKARFEASRRLGQVNDVIKDLQEDEKLVTVPEAVNRESDEEVLKRKSALFNSFKPRKEENGAAESSKGGAKPRPSGLTKSTKKS